MPRALAQRRHGLRGDHLVAHFGKPCGIAPGASADVEDAGRRFREEIEDGAVQRFEGLGRIVLEQSRGLFGIAFGSADDGRHGHPPLGREL